MFCFTSGTTGEPKAAKLSHSGFVGVQHLVEHSGFGLNANDVSISYLPYAHVFEQRAIIFSLTRGFAHGFYSGDALKLFDDVRTLKPTFLATVPRILNRLHSSIIEGAKNKTPF